MVIYKVLEARRELRYYYAGTDHVKSCMYHIMYHITVLYWNIKRSLIARFSALCTELQVVQELI